MQRFIPERWKTILALLMAVIALKQNLFFVWGMFCVFWSWENFRSKEAYFVERIELKKNPTLFWIIVLSWLAMGALYFFMDKNIFDFFYRL
ncbi:hypothetical protein [Vibrio coralliilyticus]|uniref:hypothetical protein n=1 Tax=Vibrio coralliilyticus TaxID=190893 RepID=UPI000BAA987E|nr:hypothetical protein [Vibrio coralliilyticus]NOI59855.1 hypothetical protein [Vibrio coralliilyticus]PAT66289.1 hypothetical protein CKA27_19890 [Vibrio coralliilyticus]